MIALSFCGMIPLAREPAHPDAIGHQKMIKRAVETAKERSDILSV
jgi:hypothetical protein